jgi:hypothetical protein
MRSRSSYIDGLNKIVEKQKQERAKQEEASPPPVKSLEQQLMGYFRTLNQEQLKRPWTMEEFLACVEGTYSKRSHPQKYLKYCCAITGGDTVHTARTLDAVGCPHPRSNVGTLEYDQLYSRS